MQYLWINPVSAGMCEEDSLKRFLERHGLTRVECRGDWGRIVRERYEASLRAGVTLADARCPEAVRLLEEIQKEPENESGIENLKVAPDRADFTSLCAGIKHASGSGGWGEDHHDAMPESCGAWKFAGT